ncbi:MAG: hypothetical protein AAFR61_12450 [Bacteroidota bacterium]
MLNKKMLHIQITEAKDLHPQEEAQMVDLYLAHHHISREACLKRIQEGFDRLVIFRTHKNGRIVGYNGYKVRTFRAPGFLRPIMAVYLGQLFIEKAYRGSHPVQWSTLKIFLKHKLFRPWYKTVIWADALTYKPYLLIAKNSHSFYPNPEKPTPPAYHMLINYLGMTHYGESYNPASGTVTKQRKLLKDHVAPIRPRLLKNPLIRFYAEKNPGHSKGNGMLVLTDYDWLVMANVVIKVAKMNMRRRRKAWKNTFYRSTSPA